MSQSNVEEIICAHWLIAALLARDTECPCWFYELLFFKAASDFLCVVYTALYP